MKDYQREFLDAALACEALRFGRFTLKSGRISPYFFNSGLFNTGARLALLGRCYADAVVDAGIEFDLLYGPAYKGIPLVAAVAMALAGGHGRDLPYAFNRKEPKDHGEGGRVIGAALAGRVLIVDDVVSAGTSIRESVGVIRAAGATPAAAAIALDRQERGQGARSAVQEVEHELGLRVVAIADLDTLLAFLGSKAGYERQQQAVAAYRTRYGVPRTR